jgi:hypothetical protein
MRTVLLPILSFLVLSTNAQLVIDDATFFIGEGAVVTVQGNLTSNVAIQAGGSGATLGKIQLKGSGAQQINTNGFVIPRLEIDNTSNATLTGDVRVGNLLEFTNGKFQLGTANFIIEDGTVISGAGASKFLETNGSGQARRLVGANVADKVIPVGSGTNYTPFMYTTTGSTYGANAYVAVQATGVAVPTPQRHPRTESFLATSWKVTKSGITGGNLVGTGSYLDPQVSGTEADIVGMFWNGSAWSRTGGTQNAGTNLVGADVTTNSGEIYGMNKFLLLNTKVMLQAAFDAGTGLMRDRLRNQTAAYSVGVTPASNLLPANDPYRSAPYSSYFAHTANANAEQIIPSALQDQANSENNLVDWVFVELRNTSNPGNVVVQTRSALVQRDGDVVDIDGVSPVYFKNEDPGEFSIGIRHRNHLGIYTKPGTFAAPLSLSPSALVNFSSNTFNSNINGNSGEAYTVSGNVNLLWTGNINGNIRTNYTGNNGPGAINNNDRLILLSDLGNNQASSLSGYFRGDVNMNRTVNYSGNSGPGFINNNDRLIILGTVLNNVEATVRTEARPN